MNLDVDSVRDILGQNILFVVFIILIVWFVVTKMAESYESIAKLLGPIGRRIEKNRARREAEHKNELRTEAKILLSETGNLEPPDYKAVKDQLRNVLEEVGAQAVTINQIQLENRGLRTYILQDEDWHWDDERAAIREDRTVRERVNFDDFIGDFMKRNSPKRTVV